MSNRTLLHWRWSSMAAIALSLILASGILSDATKADEITQRATVFDSGGGLLASPNYSAVVTLGESLVHPLQLSNGLPRVDPGYIAQIKLIRHLYVPASAESDIPVFVNRLHGGFPNPFNPVTTIRLSLAQDGPASVVVYDVGGRQVRELLSGSVVAGVHDIPWDGRRDNGAPAGSGIFFVRLAARGFVDDAKLVLLK